MEFVVGNNKQLSMRNWLVCFLIYCNIDWINVFPIRFFFYSRQYYQTILLIIRFIYGYIINKRLEIVFSHETNNVSTYACSGLLLDVSVCPGFYCFKLHTQQWNAPVSSI